MRKAQLAPASDPRSLLPRGDCVSGKCTNEVRPRPDDLVAGVGRDSLRVSVALAALGAIGQRGEGEERALRPEWRLQNGGVAVSR